MVCFVCPRPATVVVRIFGEEKPCCSKHGLNLYRNLLAAA